MKSIIYFLLFIFLLGPIQAVAQQWELDTAHTNFYFEVNHTYVAVRGQFMDFTGEVYFNPENLTNSKFDFVINVNSIDTKMDKMGDKLDQILLKR